MAEISVAAKNMAEFLKNRLILHRQAIKILAAINIAEYLKIRHICISPQLGENLASLTY